MRTAVKQLFPFYEVRDSVRDLQIDSDNWKGRRVGTNHVDVVRLAKHIPGCSVARYWRNCEGRQRYELVCVF